MGLGMDQGQDKESCMYLRLGARFRSQVVVNTCLPEYLQ